MQIKQSERCDGKPAGKADWAKFLIASTMIVGIGVGAALCNELMHRDCAGHELMAGRGGALLIEKGKPQEKR